jgi:hypothetical protein
MDTMAGVVILAGHYIDFSIWLCLVRLETDGL